MQTRAGWPVAIGSLVASLAVIAAVMLSISRSDVVVDAAGLRAGRQRLPASSIGRVRALDAATAREVLGPAARADAELSLRPWIRTAVQIEVRSNDATAGDSAAPYWVVASRHPAELVAALRGQPHGI